MPDRRGMCISGRRAGPFLTSMTGSSETSPSTTTRWRRRPWRGRHVRQSGEEPLEDSAAVIDGSVSAVIVRDLSWVANAAL
jgi:hypothetical protein